MKRGLIIVFLALVLSAYIVSSEVYIQQPESLYSIGDILNISVVASSTSKTSGFLSVSLICGGAETEIYRSMQIVQAGSQNKVEVLAILDNNLLEGIGGKNCYIKADYGSSSSVTQVFEVSNKINVYINVEGVSFYPNDKVVVSGKATKLNGDLIKGYVEIIVGGSFSDVSVPDNSMENDSIAEDNSSNVISEFSGKGYLGEIKDSVSEGEFNLEFVIPGDMPQGNYDLNVRVHDEDEQGNLLNEGYATSNIKINQVIKEIEIFFEKGDSVIPGNYFYLRPVLYDQAGQIGTGDVELTVKWPDKSEFSKRISGSNVEQEYFIDSNYTPGSWFVEANYDDLSLTDNFFVEEQALISSKLEDGILTITNVGNVYFKKFVEIFIGNVSEIKLIELEVGESKKFKLSAPDGEYDIQIKDGDDVNSLGTNFLTGKSSSIDEVDAGFLSTISYVTVLLLLFLIVLLIAVVVLVKKVFWKKYKERSNLSTQNNPTKNVNGFISSQEIQDGKKEICTVLCLNIKNLEEINRSESYIKNSALEAIDEALTKVKQYGPKIYVDNNYRMIIFSPSASKKMEGVEFMVDAAKEIEEVLTAYNNLHSLGIKYGIGLHRGELVVENSGGAMRFVSIGNTLSFAKRISDISNSEVLLSDELHRVTLAKIKVDKHSEGIWKLKRSINREKYDEFINKFLDSQKKDHVSRTKNSGFKPN